MTTDGIAYDDAQQQAKEKVGKDDPGLLHELRKQLAERQRREDREERVQDRLCRDRVCLTLGLMCARSGGRGGWRQVIAPDEILRQRPSQQAAEHEARSRARHRQLHRAGDVHRVGEPGAVGRACAMPAGERNRAAQQADHRMKVRARAAPMPTTF